MKEYQINVIAGTKVIADMAQSIKDKTINDQRMKAVPPGPLPAGPPDKEMYMELLSEGTWAFNGVDVATNPKGSILNLWWNKVTWSKDDGVELPVTNGVDVINPEGSGLPTEKATANYIEPLFRLTSESTNIIDNTKVEAGAIRLNDGTKIETDNSIRSLIRAIPEGKTHISIGGIGNNQAGIQSVFAFYTNSDGTGYISGSNNKIGTAIPTGAKYYIITFCSETNVGVDPLNNPYKNTMQANWGATLLPYEPFAVMVDAKKISGVQPVVQTGLTNLDTRVAFLESQTNYEYKFPVGQSVDGLNHLINSDGDYIEFTARIETLVSNNQLRMFGESGTSLRNSLGFYTNVLRLRGNVNSEAWAEFTGLPSFGDYHVYKLVVNGSNWDLYIDGSFSQSKPKPSGLLVTTIGNAYTQTLPFWLIENVIIKVGTSVTSYRNFSQYNPNIEKISLDPALSSAPSVFVEYSPTGGSGNGEFIVYTRRSGRSTYTGIQIRREIDNTRYWDYWRIYKAMEYNFDSGSMIMLTDNILTLGESEFTWQQKGKDSHTGGAHQYEQFQLMKAYIDGKEMNLSTPISLTVCESFYYTEKSEMIERPWIDNTPTVVGRNVQAEHYKRTDIIQGQYKVKNTLKWKQALTNVLYMYIGIVCVGRASAINAHDDFFNQTALGDVAGKKLDGTGRNTLNLINTATKYNCEISAIMTIKNIDYRYYLWLQDRLAQNDTKYYFVNNTSNDPNLATPISVQVGEVWEAECTVKFN